MSNRVFFPSALFWPALFLGLIQGITEFLPISSSGHLVLGSHFLPLSHPSLLFDVLLHIGTLAPVIWFYRRDLLAMVKELIHWPSRRLSFTEAMGDPNLNLVWAVSVGTIPTAVIGVLFKNIFERLFSNLSALGVTFLVTGVLLLITRYFSTPQRTVGENSASTSTLVLTWQALVIGLVQGCAITPGISRSGSTIAVGLLLGMDRTVAARFSFLLAIPAILGAMVLHLPQVGGIDGSVLGNYVAGTLMAAVSGYLALWLLVRMVSKGDLHWFSFYLFPLGIAVILYTQLLL